MTYRRMLLSVLGPAEARLLNPGVPRQIYKSMTEALAPRLRQWGEASKRCLNTVQHFVPTQEE